ncbi:MAG: hypothetical protein M1831_001688 [Alyxoria varia]|nr:MAG: hypothetical protein M1831_001688 [Alyxoria varia]
MHYSTAAIAIAALAQAAYAAPAAEKKDPYAWDVTNFGAGCSPGGCSYGFDISGPYRDEGTTSIPGFSAKCSGVADRPDYNVCQQFAEATVYAKVENVQQPKYGWNVYVSYVYYNIQNQGRYNYTGHEIAYPPRGTSNTNFTIEPDQVSAVAKRDEPPAGFGLEDTFDCAASQEACNAQEFSNPDTCAYKKTECDKCAAKEVQCRKDPTNFLSCTIAAQECYHTAENPGSVNEYPGSYACNAAQSTCLNAPVTNEGICNQQNSACLRCVDEENACRTAPNANQAFCSAQAAGCFGRAMSLNPQ